MTGQTRRSVPGAWALVLSMAVGSSVVADEKAQGTSRGAAQAAPVASGTKRDATAMPADAPKLTAGAEGFALQSSNGDYKLQLRGYVQFDGRFFPSDEGGLAVDNFLLRRVRPIFAGTVGAPLRVPDHAGLRRRHDGAAGRLARRQVLAEGAGPGRASSSPRSASSGCSRPRRSRSSSGPTRRRSSPTATWA